MTEIAKPARVAAPGDNVPDFAKDETSRLEIDYAPLAGTVADLVARATLEVPAQVTTDEQLAAVNRLVVEMRDLAGRCESARVPEKEPHYRRGQAVDQFFTRMKDRLAGMIREIGARGHAYNERKLAEERRKREAEARERERIAREAREKAEAEERAAREAEEKARRARNEENKAAHQQRADEHAANAAGAKEEAVNAGAAAMDARVDAQAKPADLTRLRTGDGRLSTMREKPYVEIVDVMKLDKDLLWPFLKEEAILAALKKYAATTNHKRPMAGAIIEMRAETEYR
jgi:septal ring factor EnvC (AmiA/AmiB activator)